MENKRLIAQPVRSLQTMLRTISRMDPSVPPVVPDGIYGRNTMASVTAFQKSAGLPITGVVDTDTWNGLRDAYARAFVSLYPESLWMSFDADQKILPGEASMQVYVIQSILAALRRVFSNVPEVQVNGRYDEQSVAAVRALQRILGIPESDVLDMMTWRRLAHLYSTAVLMEKLLKKDFFKNA